MATTYKRSEDKVKKKSCWYIGYKDENGKQRTKKGFTDRKASQDLAEKLEREASLRREGLVDPAAEKLRDQRATPIDEVLDLFEAAIKIRRTTQKNVSLTLSRVRKVVKGCGFQFLADLDTEPVQRFLDKYSREEDLGHSTINHYMQAVISLGNWLVSTKRTAGNPFAGLKRLNAEVDIRHKRRALSVEEFSKLVESARSSGEKVQGVTPENRARLYTISGLTGLRRKEIASLTPRSFNLKASPPTVTVKAACSKHRRTDVLPLHPELIAVLPEWLSGLKPDQPLFPSLLNQRAYLMVKADLERIGIPYETSEGFADFHAAGRHTYITSLLKNGATLPEAKELARHCDVTMTMRYTHIGISDQAKALANLPFRECNRSNSETAGGHPVTSPGTETPTTSTPDGPSPPAENQGYVILCLPKTPADTFEKKLVRRDKNPKRKRGDVTWWLHCPHTLESEKVLLTRDENPMG